MYKQILFSIFFLLIIGKTFAQLEESDTARWQFNSTVSLRLNTGNIQRLIVTPEANVSHLPKNKLWGFSMRQRYTFGTFGKYRTENDLLSRNFLYFIPEKRVYPYIMLWMNTHERQRLSFRYQVGPGVTFVPLKKGNQIIKLSATFSYEQNWYKEDKLTLISDTLARNYNVFRATARIFGSHKLAKGIVDIYYEFLWQPSLTSLQNWRLFAEGGVNVKIVKGFSMRSFITYEYQQVHVTTEKPNDLVLSIGVNYKWQTKKAEGRK